jgi:NAD(P)-dependent dehydrogenase (short-subunit alcohol dehydrogenase family)
LKSKPGDIVKSTGSSRVEVMQLDLGSLASVRRFVTEFVRENKQLDVLINNAAAMSLPNKLSSDGLQQEMQINQFGPFLLTILLLGNASSA